MAKLRAIIGDVLAVCPQAYLSANPQATAGSDVGGSLGAALFGRIRNERFFTGGRAAFLVTSGREDMAAFPTLRESCCASLSTYRLCGLNARYLFVYAI